MKAYTLSNLMNLTYKNKKIKTTKNLLFSSLKNYYYILSNYKFLYVNSPSYIINFFYTNLYFLNVIHNKNLKK